MSSNLQVIATLCHGIADRVRFANTADGQRGLHEMADVLRNLRAALAPCGSAYADVRGVIRHCESELRAGSGQSSAQLHDLAELLTSVAAILGPELQHDTATPPRAPAPQRAIRRRRSYKRVVQGEPIVYRDRGCTALATG